MSSKKELEKREDENRALRERLSDTEVELTRKEDALKSANLRKAELLNDLREYQHKLKDVKNQLEKAECAEMEAKASAHDAKLSLEHVEAQRRDQATALKATTNSFQLEIRNLKAKVLEKEEENDKVLLELKQTEDQLFSLRDQQQKHDRDGSSRIANLNQALMKAKQTCAQVTEENEAIQQREMELVRRIEGLEHENVLLAKKQGIPCKDCQEREATGPCTPVRKCSPATPIKPFPEETELDSLQIENNKLKQELQCLQINFQLSSEKSFHMKKEAKENEKALVELQSQFEHMLTEKEDLKQKYEDLRSALVNTTGSQLRQKERGVELENEVTTLREELEQLQEQKAEIQEMLTAELKNSLKSQEVVEKLDTQMKIVKEQNSELEDEISIARETIQELECRLSSLEQASENRSEFQQRAAAIAHSYDRKLAALSAEKEELSNHLDRVESSLDASRDQVNLLEESRRDLQVKLAALEAKNALLVARGREQSNLPDEVSKLQKELIRLTEQYEEVCAERIQHDVAQQHSKSKIEDLKRANSKLQDEVKQNWELSKKLENELEKRESSLSEVQEDLREKQQHCIKMVNKVEEIQLELASANNAKTMYETEVSKLMERLESLEQCNFELTTKLSDTENHSTSAQFTLTEAQTKLFDLEKKLQEVESIVLEKESLISDLTCTCEMMENENTTLLSQVTSLSEMVAARNTKIEALQAHLCKYESDTQEIVQMITELEADHGQCAGVKTALQNEIESLKQSLEVALSQQKETEGTTLSLKLEVKQLQVYNGSLESINAGLQEKIQSQIAKCEELSGDQQSAERREYELEQELKMKAASLKTAMEEIELTKKNAEDAQITLRAEVESIEEKCSKLHEECEEMYQEKRRMEARLVALQSEVGEQKQIISTLSSENEVLSDKVETSRSTLVSTKDEVIAVQRKLGNAEAAQRYTEKKLAESRREVESVKEELSTICKQYERLRDTALSVLEPDSSSDGENAKSSATAPKRQRLKGILKKSSSVLKPKENIID